MKVFERIFLYTVLAILVFYVFLVDVNVESQVFIQEEIKARSIVIVNAAGQGVVWLSADSRTGGGGRVDVFNGDGTFGASMCGSIYGGGIMINNRYGNLSTFMGADKDGKGEILVCNRDGKVIGSLP